VYINSILEVQKLGLELMVVKTWPNKQVGTLVFLLKQ